MNLKPMSLGKDNTKNTPSNEGIKVYIESSTEDNCPLLFIVDAFNSTKFIMSFFRNTYLQVNLVNIQDYPSKYSGKYGQSTDDFSRVINRIDKYQDANSILTRDLLIYGFLCESFSKAGLPLEMITQYTDIVTKFISESLCYYNYRTHDIKFDLSNLLPCIQVKKEVDNHEGNNLKSFILPGEITSMGLICKGLIGVDKGFVYVKPSLQDIYKIDYPDFLATVNDSSIISDAVNSLLWVLLKHLNFYGNDVFKNQNEDIKFKVYPAMLNAIPFTTPPNLRLEMRLDARETQMLKIRQ